VEGSREYINPEIAEGWFGGKGNHFYCLATRKAIRKRRRKDLVFLSPEIKQ